ncbi:MAG: hypothetical protein V4733_04765 [Verrucomicrobiota bacterium]
MKNNIPFALVGGLVAMLVGAAIWAVITVVTNYQIGFMAVGVGFLVGFAVRFAGKGETMIFAVIGAVFALLGCLAGNLFSALGFLSKEYEIPFFELLGKFDFSKAPELFKETFSGMDLLFYAIAVYEGFKLSRVPSEETAAVESPPTE